MRIVTALFVLSLTSCGSGGGGGGRPQAPPARELDGFLTLRIDLEQSTTLLTAQPSQCIGNSCSPTGPAEVLLDTATPTRDSIIVPGFQAGFWIIEAKTTDGGCGLFNIEILEEDADDADVYILRVCSGRRG
jgi:hypothetical protein